MQLNTCVCSIYRHTIQPNPTSNREIGRERRVSWFKTAKQGRLIFLRESKAKLNKSTKSFAKQKRNSLGLMGKLKFCPTIFTRFFYGYWLISGQDTQSQSYKASTSSPQ